MPLLRKTDIQQLGRLDDVQNYDTIASSTEAFVPYIVDERVRRFDTHASQGKVIVPLEIKL